MDVLGRLISVFVSYHGSPHSYQFSCHDNRVIEVEMAKKNHQAKPGLGYQKALTLGAPNGCLSYIGPRFTGMLRGKGFCLVNRSSGKSGLGVLGFGHRVRIKSLLLDIESALNLDKESVSTRVRLPLTQTRPSPLLKTFPSY
eukprot:sb/3474147/